MYCRYCGKELPYDSNFCPSCGNNQNNSFSRSFDVLKTIGKFYENHKVVLNTFIVWLVLHVTLYIMSSKGDYSRKIFYPFNMEFGEVLQGKDYYGNRVNVSFLDYLDGYDFTEFFVYVILVPLIIIGITRFVPYLWIKLNGMCSSIGNKISEINRTQKIEVEEIIEIVEDNCSKEEKTTFHAPIEMSNSKHNDMEQSIKIVRPCEEDGYVSQKNGNLHNNDVVSDYETRYNSSSYIEKKKDENKEAVKMPLFMRFVGSLIDKVIILILFVLIPVIFFPYLAPGKLGTYVGLLTFSPSNYAYIPETYKQIDISFSIWLIVLNVIYFFLFEWNLHASLGKWLMGGNLRLWDKEEIEIKWIRHRAYFRIIAMSLFIYGVHFELGMNNLLVLIIYLLIMDVPILFTKKSLLDMCTDTCYEKFVK